MLGLNSYNSFSLKLPAGHGRHDSMLGLGAYDPSAQGLVKVLALPGQKVPIGQG